jgi:hypothetical protein
MLHAYFMAPMRTSETTMHSQTMCKKNVATNLIAQDGKTVECAECIARVRLWLVDSKPRLERHSKDEALKAWYEKLKELLPENHRKGL